MSSHEDPHHHSTSGSGYYESGSGFPDTQPRSLGQPWPPIATTDDGDESGYSQYDQSWVQVQNTLEAYGVYGGESHSSYDLNNPADYPPSLSYPQDINPTFNPGPSQPLTSTLPQDLGVGTAAAYIPGYIPFDNLPFYPHPGFDCGHPQYPSDATPDPAYDPQLQPPVHDTDQNFAQGIDASQASRSLVYPSSSSSQLPPLSSGEHMYWPDDRIPGSLMLDEVKAAGANLSAGQHSHHSPVATSSNQRLAPGQSHPPPRSPDRDRRRLSAADESPLTQRRLARRHDHSSPSVSLRRRRSYPDVCGRGPLIPQERYRTSTVSSYNAANLPPFIPFNLENPDQRGIPIIDILNKTDGFHRIRDRTQVFDMEKKTFTLRVRWPGYKSWSKTIAALDWTKSRSPITRVKLAEAVATAVQGLFEKYYNEPYDLDYAMWNLGPSGIQLNQICLVSLHQVSRGSWQPELCLL